ncbi:MAG: S8 family serine peptidase [Bacteroidetes bacterium]|nr:S8 family serine peptidase [Bacteroidota bacterium]
MKKKNSPEKKPTRIPVIEGEWKGKKVKFRPDRIVVKLKVAKREKEYEFLKDKCEDISRLVPDSKVLRYPQKTPLLVLRVPEKSNVVELAEEISKRDDVVYAEPDFVGTIGVVPDDTKYADQWGPKKINAEAAWDLETGGNDILIGIIDTGLATANDGSLNHPDLDDAARYILGTDFVSDDNLPRDDHSHGTHVAGIAAALSNNAEGVVGMNWNSPVYVCKTFDSSGSGSQSDFESAIEEIVDYAVANNLLAVINLSAGWTSGSQTLRDACQYVEDNGMLFCAITHNDSSTSIRFPAAYTADFDSLIAVGSTDDDDTVSSFSNTGPEITLVAPGRDILATTPTYAVTSGDTDYDEKTGTSMACPHVAGLASLVWSREPKQTNEQVKDVLINTAEKLGTGNFDNSWGYGRIDAEKAVAKSGWDIELPYDSLDFIDIPENETTARAIRFNVKSFHATNFEIIDGPTGVFEVTFEPNTSLGKSTDYDTVRDAYIWISYAGTNDGDSHNGTVRVRCIETEQEWELTINANTIARPSSCVMMVFDKSNSMSFDSGIEGERRIDVLRYSANILVDVIQEGNGIGIVAFDQDPHDVLIPVVGPLGEPSGIDPDRVNIRTSISTFDYNPSGITSIGDGIERASTRLNPVTGYDNKAMLVLTDGKENEEKYISEVSDLINDKVFAVGLGTAANINPNALTEVCNNTGGYTLLTDELDNDSYFKLAKYFLQILAGITNEDVVVDPDGWINQGETHKIPFNLNEADISTDIILMMPYHDLIDLYLEAPDGTMIDSGSPTVGIYSAENVRFYRVTLPAPTTGGSSAHAGKWHAVLKFNGKYFKRYLASLDNYPNAYSTAKTHGVQYTLLVHAYSNLRMRCTLSQNSYEPGAIINLRATLTEYGVPIRKSASVRTELTCPDNSITNISFHEIQRGIYEADVTANQSGVYQFRVIADGFTHRNTRYTREQVLTGTTWKGGDLPFPESGDDTDNVKQTLCKLISCLDKNMSNELHDRLVKNGLNLKGLIKCLCYEKRERKYRSTEHLKLDKAELSQFLKILSEEVKED